MNSRPPVDWVADLGGSVSIFAADGVANVLHGALNGISFRQNVIADNIANVDTPDFRARSVDFESSLKDAVSRGGVGADGVDIDVAMTSTPVGVNGNNVDLRKEMLAATQTQFQYQLLTRAIAGKFASIKTAAGY